MEINTNTPILVTGATGYVASHLIKVLLERGHKVRGTVRSLTNKTKYEFLYQLVPEKKDNLTFVEADLTDRASWSAAVEGCEYIFHVASPIPSANPKDEMELIGPAVAGTVNVLEAAVEKKAKKVVVTSSCLTLMAGNEHKLITEEDWADDSKLPAYPKSKVRAEKAAWEFYEKNKDKIEVTVVNPTMVLGPAYTVYKKLPELLFADILNGPFPGIFDVHLGVVDVRDVAEGHYKAMFTQGTTGKRYALTTGPWPLGEIVTDLKREFGKYGYEINDKQATVEDVKGSANPAVKIISMHMEKVIRVSNERSVKELGLIYSELNQTVIDTGYSLIKHGIIPDKTQKK